MNAVLLVAAACLSAGPTNSAIVHLRLKDGGSSGVIISATFREHEGWFYNILTCAHGKESGSKPSVRFNGNFSTDGQVIAINESMDLALVRVLTGHRYGVVKLLGEHEGIPEAGTIVRVAGYGSDNHRVIYSERQTKTTGTFKFDNWENPLLGIAATTRPGDSGGALLLDGKLCGIHVAGNKRFNNRDGFSVTHKEIHKFLEEAGHHP